MESSGQSRNRSDITFDAIRNSSALSVQTSSEWDPGPDKSAYTVPAVEEYKADYLLTSGHFQAEDWCRAEPDARDPKSILVKTIPHGPTHPVEEFLWPPKIGNEQASHTPLTILIATLDTRNAPGAHFNTPTAVGGGDISS